MNFEHLTDVSPTLNDKLRPGPRSGITTVAAKKKRNLIFRNVWINIFTFSMAFPLNMTQSPVAMDSVSRIGGYVFKKQSLGNLNANLISTDF